MRKTDSRMELRGKLDSLNAAIIFMQSCSPDDGYIADIESLREVVVRLQYCEARNESYSDRLILLGLDEEEIHSRSHHPESHYGLGHILPHRDMGRESAGLNLLRTLVRETELASCRAFEADELNISHVLNRLSSALYILTYKYLPEGYDKVIRFGRA